MQVEYKTEKGVVLFVKVPDDARDFEVSKWSYQKQDYTEYLTLIFESNNYDNLKKGDRPHIQLSVKSFILIGLSTEITEEEAKMMVECVDEIHRLYRDYKPARFINYNNALSSFRSLMNMVKLYEINPINHPIERLQYGGGYAMRQNEIDVYEEAQSRTGKWVVLFKPNV